MSGDAGPPVGGSYLIPPSVGGLCEGVITMPSASCALSLIFLLYSRIARDITGVGVGAKFCDKIIFTPFAANTSMQVLSAGSLNA